ncbi:MAG: hypothetical protein DLM70_01895 [Chloroflexi bacterium]|nr:MAG: hypothetical protein DLM70_01895 [Chloroflexota bacterium]
MGGIFDKYRTLHELLFRDTVQAVVDWQRGVMGEEEFRAFIRWRDGLCRLDMDASSFNCYYVDVLAEEFEDAKFIFAIRDCFSWFDSMLGMALAMHEETPPWMLEYFRRFLGPGFELELTEHPDELHMRLPGMVDAGMRYWSTVNQFMLHALPAPRSLVVRTHELSHSLPRLAAFVGIPPETLVPKLMHLNEARTTHRLLRAVDPAFLSDVVEEHGTELMREFFPKVTLAGFLGGARPA